MMEIFGLSYLVLGLIAVAGCVLDADGVIEAILNLPTRMMDFVCEVMRKFLQTHRPTWIQKIDFGPLPITDIPKDRIFDVSFIVGETDVEYFRRKSKDNFERDLSWAYTNIPERDRGAMLEACSGCSENRELEKFIRERVRRYFYERIFDFVSIRIITLPSGDIKVNTELVCRQPNEPRFAWAETEEMLVTSKRFR